MKRGVQAGISIGKEAEGQEHRVHDPSDKNTVRASLRKGNYSIYAAQQVDQNGIDRAFVRMPGVQELCNSILDLRSERLKENMPWRSMPVQDVGENL